MRDNIVISADDFRIAKARQLSSVSNDVAGLARTNYASNVAEEEAREILDVHGLTEMSLADKRRALSVWENEGGAYQATDSLRKELSMKTHDTVITENDQKRLRIVLDGARRSDGSEASEILRLGDRISRAQVVGSKDVPRNVVTMNSVVTLRNLETGDRTTCTLVYPHEARSFARAVSVARPLGQAMLGKRVGQIIRWPSGARDRRLRIQSIPYQPEAAGDLNL